jgi:hypothetical protein
MAASRFVEVTNKEISEIKINSVQKKHKEQEQLRKTQLASPTAVCIFII